jgi:hypothetical protein
MKPNFQNRFGQDRQAAITLCDFGAKHRLALHEARETQTPQSRATRFILPNGSDETKKNKTKTTNPLCKEEHSLK